MTPEAKRIAIAEACGWRDIEPVLTMPPVGNPPRKLSQKIFLPDYVNDLNAMQMAFGSLNEEQKRLCVYYVIKLLKTGQFLFDATAAQWAEAFLRTTGKWVNE